MKGLQIIILIVTYTSLELSHFSFLDRNREISFLAWDNSFCRRFTWNSALLQVNFILLTCILSVEVSPSLDRRILDWLRDFRSDFGRQYELYAWNEDSETTKILLLVFS